MIQPRRYQLPADYHEGNLGQRLPHIEFTPELMKTVETIVGSETNPLIKARKIFYWIAQNVAYNSEEEYCTIPSFSRACFDRRRGDCGIQSTLFITMARMPPASPRDGNPAGKPSPTI